MPLFTELERYLRRRLTLNMALLQLGRESLIVGLMSGTSADGIDAVVVAIAGTGAGLGAKILAHVHTSFAASLRQQILRVSVDGRVNEICELNFLLGEHFARTALKV